MFYRMYDEKKGNNKNGEALNSQGIFRPAVNFIGVRRKLTQVTAFVLSFLLLFTSIDITAFASEVEVTQEISVQSETGGEAAPAAAETPAADSSAGAGSEGQAQDGSTDSTGQGEGSGTSGDAGTTGGTGTIEGTGTTENPGTENPGTGSSTEAGSGEGGSTGENPGETTEEPDEETAEDELEEEEIEEELEDEEEEEEEEVKVAFKQSLVENGIEIMVSAPEGVFPEGASLRVKTITRESDVAEIEQLLAEEKDAAADENTLVEVEQSYSFDITIADKNGNEIEPDTRYGDVSVTFKNVGVAEVEQADEKELSVYYVSDDYSQAEEIDHETNVSEDAAVITAEHFSIYTVVITSGTLKDSILHYYQGSSIANSYFTIYNEEQLLKYQQLVNGWVAGSVKDDSFSTILVNSDDANPVEGITGEGQATDMKVKDLNMSAKLMDDVTVTSEWSTPITKLCENHSFDGKGHTITFKKLNSSLISKFNAGDADDGVTNYVFIGSDNNGSIKNLTLKYGNKTYNYLSDEEEETKYASITVRVDGEKAEIGEAITGAEALAASADGENYITLERDDDLSVYSTELENLYPVNEETGEVDDETKKLVYNVYYVYEDENETISAAQFTYEDYEAELNYVSVTYNLEGANTYKEESDGSLSEDVMAAVRVDVNEGKYVAQEDYDAVVMAADGYEIPTKEYHVVVKIGGANGTELTRGTDYKYTYSSSTKRGKIHINKAKITDSVYVEVSADVLADKGANKIILKTRGGTITDALWEKDADGQYSQTVYAGSGATTLPTSVTPYKGSDSIKFAGWYQDMAGTGTKYTSHSFVSTADGKTTPVTYYAKWVLAKTESSNGSLKYFYMNDKNCGNLNVKGTQTTGEEKITYGNNGFYHSYQLGNLTDAQKKEQQKAAP